MPPHVALKQMSDNGSGWTLVGRTRDLRYVATAVVGIDKIPGLSAEIGPVTPVDPPAVVAPARVDAAPGASPTPAPAPSPSSSPMVSFQIDVRRQTGVTP